MVIYPLVLYEQAMAEQVNHPTIAQKVAGQFHLSSGFSQGLQARNRGYCRPAMHERNFTTGSYANGGLQNALLHGPRFGSDICLAMVVTLSNLSLPTGIQKLNDYLLTRSYIIGYQASKDDIAVYSALSAAPSVDYVNVAKWFKHIDALLRISGISSEGQDVTVQGPATPEETPLSPPVADSKAPAANDEDDDDVDIFGEETEEEKNAAEQCADAVKAYTKKKESGKSSLLLDVKPWDDETYMKKLEEAVRSVQLEGLLLLG